MKEIWWHGVVILYGWHAELHVGVRNVGLTVVKPSSLHHLLPHGREGPVAAYHQVGLHGHLGLLPFLQELCIGIIFKPEMSFT